MKYLSIIFLWFSVNVVYSQVLPKNNAKLNYTQVMFEYPEIKNAVLYTIQISENPSNNNFDKSIILNQNEKSTASLVNGLKFGSKYQWKYIAYNKSKKIIHISELFKFEILPINHINTVNYNYRINKNYDDGILIFLDGSRVAINRKGEPVWFLPVDSITTRCLKMTKEGTITYIATNMNLTTTGTEVTINGDTLWRTPKKGKNLQGDSANSYHHELVKLRNGNYMIMLNKYIKPKKEIRADKIFYSTIIEFDPNNNIVWHWDSQKYLSDTDVIYSNDNPRKIINNNGVRNFDAGHCNGFYFDEANNILYASVRDLSRIIKVDKISGKMIACYGDKYPSGEAKYANGFFKYMHSPKVLPNGNIVLFSNNLNGDRSPVRAIASVVIFTQPNSYKDSSEKIWEFKCDFDNLYQSFSYGSGNIEYLENKNLLVNMGDPVSRIFEVTPEKKVIWDCFTEQYSEIFSNWVPSFNYRVSTTKSLFPIYFTLSNSMNPDTIQFKKNLNLAFKINNNGSSSDTYSVKCYINEKEYKVINTEEVLPYKSHEVEINFRDIEIKNQKITIKVSSLTNIQFKRTLNFYID